MITIAAKPMSAPAIAPAWDGEECEGEELGLGAVGPENDCAVRADIALFIATFHDRLFLRNTYSM